MLGGGPLTPLCGFKLLPCSFGGERCTRLSGAFLQLTADIGAKDAGFSLRSLRRGGATYDFSDCKSYSMVCERGRWASLSSCRIYLSDGMAALLTVDAWEDQIPSLGARARLGQRLFASIAH